jgi:5-deoxy-glucuronate isomerase
MAVVHESAIPNNLPGDDLRLRLGDDGHAAVDPSVAGWRYLAFAVHRLTSNAFAPTYIGQPGHETVVVTLSGGTLMTFDGEAPVRLPGRASVFDDLPWAAYLPAGRTAALEPIGELAEVAVAEAPISGRQGVTTDLVVIGPDDVKVEVEEARGATWRVHHIVAPDFPADRLMLLETHIPSGNWSGWPPHRHDRDDMPDEAVLEEVDHYRFRGAHGWGVQRLYRADGSRDALLAIVNGDTVLVTDGYHPFVTTPGHDAYCLLVMAGDRRTLANSTDPGR